MGYKVIRSKNRKNIELRVIDNEVYIYVPECVSDFTIQNVFEEFKNKLNFNKNKDNIVYYLGKEYNIIVEKVKILKDTLYEIKDSNFYIFIPSNTDSYNIKDLIKKWQRKQAYDLIIDRLKYFLDKYKFNFNIRLNKVTIRNQKTKWGSCTFFNNLNFNYRVIEKRLEVIDYLIVHELCHTIHKNHSKKFWELVENIIPNYKLLRNELNNIK